MAVRGAVPALSRRLRFLTRTPTPAAPVQEVRARKRGLGERNARGRTQQPRMPPEGEEEEGEEGGKEERQTEEGDQT